jgi:hypothetical protein
MRVIEGNLPTRSSSTFLKTGSTHLTTRAVNLMPLRLQTRCRAFLRGVIPAKEGHPGGCWSRAESSDLHSGWFPGFVGRTETLSASATSRECGRAGFRAVLDCRRLRALACR